MSTARQRAANQENSKKSTGPVTPEGKAISSRNRVSAGFNTTVSYFLDHEKKEDFLQLLEDFTNQYQPANPTEQVLVERMVHNQWNTLRAIRLQSQILFSRFPSSEPLPHDFNLFIRYQTAAERAFDRAHTELIKAQKEREKSEIGFVSQTADPAPPPVPEPTHAAPEARPEAPQTPETASEIVLQPDLTLAEDELAVPDSENLSQAA
jgi:hypothetical protein